MSETLRDIPPTAGADTPTRPPGFRLPVWVWLTLWMVAWVGIAVIVHYAVRGVVNGFQVALAFFLAINIMVCWWEISLGARIGDIERWHHDPDGRRERPRGTVYMVRASLRDLASTRLWARVWSEYAFFDASYADRRSFGFAGDVGNGWSTLVPSFLFLVGMTTGIFPPVVLGLFGALIFYQKFYCTSLYFAMYIFNRRYTGHRLGRLIAVVGGTNGLWLVFPAIGLYVCTRLIIENRFDVLWS
jgi:hypothetical protein